MVVLKEMNRVVKPIIGDGNCFFRLVAQIVYGDEMLHGKIRELLADFISQNCADFQPYINGDIHCQSTANKSVGNSSGAVSSCLTF